jgi:hypothetical protein
MPESASAAKGKHEPKKQPVRAPQNEANTSAPDVQPLETPLQSFSPQQLIRLQRTVGNKAVGDLLRKQKTPVAPQAEAAPTADVNLQTSGDVVQTWPWSSKKKEATVPPPPSTPPPASAASPSAPPPAFSREAPIVAQGPQSVIPVTLDSNVKATDEQKANPILALKTYREAVGVHLREAKRDKFKIARYKTFLEADFIFLKSNVPILVKEEESLTREKATAAAIQNPKEQKKILAKLKDREDAFKKKKAAIKETDLPGAEAKSEERLNTAHQANLIAENELPLVEHAYDTLVSMRHEGLEGVKHGKLFGSGNSQGRINVLSRELRGIESEEIIDPKKQAARKIKATKIRLKIAKHTKRLEAINKAKADLAEGEMLRGQAKLSQDLMAVRRRQLKAKKQEVKKTERNVQIGSHLLGKAATAVQSTVVSTLTLGTIEYEQTKMDGGYTSKRERVSMLDTWKRDWASLKNVWATRPYGKMTALHLFFQGLGTLILKPLRKVFTAASLIFAGLSLIPGVAVFTAPLAAFCTLVTLGLAAAKVALDAVLALWSSLTLALNKNAHNTDVLRGQATGQALDVLSGTIAVAGGVAAPMIANTAGGSYIDPTKNLHHGGSVMDFSGGSVGSTDIGHMAQVLSTKGSATLGMVLAEKGAGALLELEALGPGAKALFKTRQEEIMKSGKSPAEIYKELREAKDFALFKNEVDLEDEIAKHEKAKKKTKDAKKIAALDAKIATARAKIAENTVKRARVQAQIAASEAAEKASKRMARAPIQQPVRRAIQRDVPTGMEAEQEKERKMREASTKSMAVRAKAQLQGLLGGLGESEAKGGELAAGAKSAADSVSSATPAQGIQPVDAPNSADALEGVTSGKDVLAQIKAIVAEGPAAVDEAINPAPASGG